MEIDSNVLIVASSWFIVHEVWASITRCGSNEVINQSPSGGWVHYCIVLEEAIITKFRDAGLILVDVEDRVADLQVVEPVQPLRERNAGGLSELLGGDQAL